MGETETAIARIAAARVTADRSQSALATLLEDALSPARTVSTTAVQAILEVPLNQLIPIAHRLPTLLHSNYAYVRTTILDLLRQMSSNDLPPTVPMDVLRQVGRIADAATLQALLRLAGDTAATLAGQRDEALLDVTTALVEAIKRGGAVDLGTLRVGIRTLIPVVWEWTDQVRAVVARFATAVLAGSDLAAVRDGERAMMDLLAALARHDRQFLPRLTEDCTPWRARNVRALACAIRRCEGPYSPLLDQLLQRPDCPAEVATAILEWRGA
jgi:hypothetical protein